MERYQHFIGGRCVNPASADWFDCVNPYTGNMCVKIVKGNAADVKPMEGGRLLNKLADLIERAAQCLGEIEVRDNGKLIAEMSAQTQHMQVKSVWITHQTSPANPFIM